jgi:hypothetical protein
LNDHKDADPLRELLVDAAEVDRQAIANVLKGRVSIDSKSGRIVLGPGYQALDARKKVLTILLAQKAALLLKISEGEALTNAEVTHLTGLAPGTSAPSLKSLRELRLVTQTGTKAYYIPNPQLNTAIDFITRGGSK